MNKKSILLLGAMVMLVALGAIIISIVNSRSVNVNKSKDDSIQVVTTFYPVYMIGLNLTDQLEDIEVKSLTDINTGCLHDYQLTTEDMKAISEADVLVINGGGMEAFLEDITANYPNLMIINSSENITMLRHDEGQEVTFDIDQLSGIEEHADREGELEEEYNPHIWLNPLLYMKQIENVRDGLIKYISSSKNFEASVITKLTEGIQQNADTYLAQIQELDSELSSDIAKIKNGQNSSEVTGTEEILQAVIFHDAFSYLADRVGIKVAFTVPLDSDTALSAGDIAMIIDAVKSNDIKFLFIEEQFSESIAQQIEAETEAKMYIIDSVVTGNGSKDSYKIAMKKNFEVIKEALK